MMNQFSAFPPQAKLWIYAADREFTSIEEAAIASAIEAFKSNWTAHEIPLTSFGGVFYHRIILLAVDENTHPISGCGIDKSVQLIKNLGQQYQIDFFNRFQVFVLQNEKLTGFYKASLQEAIDKGAISENTLVFNSLVQNGQDLIEKGFVPLENHWLAKQLKFSPKETLISQN